MMGGRTDVNVGRGTLRGLPFTPVTAAVARAQRSGPRTVSTFRMTVFLEVEVMVEQREDEDAADEIAPWEMWP